MNQEIVQCHDLKFKKLYTKDVIEKEIDRIAEEVQAYCREIKAKDPNAKILMLGLLNGAFMFVSEVMRRLHTPIMVQFVKVKSYKGTESCKLQFQSHINTELIEGSHVILMDDICDTGRTLATLHHKLMNEIKAKSIKIGVLVIRPDKEQAIKPDMVGLTCSGFIIGYGLDYNLLGRQYPEIYQKIDEE